MHNFSDTRCRQSTIHRRSFLATSAASLTTSPAISSTTAETSLPTLNRNIVKVILQGGPSQIDLWDPKPNADIETRGPFESISTQSSGIRVSECLPNIAKNINDFTIVRSVIGSFGSHNLMQATTRLVSPRTSPRQRRSVAATSFSNAQALLESGLGDIVLKFGHWDHHRSLKAAIESQAYALDTELTSFVQSLNDTGLLKSTIVLVWGEFGRAPRMNAMGGRDHWPAVNSALIAGGTNDRGNVWGATSHDGTHVVDGAVSMSDLLQDCQTDAAVLT